jgi:hypothetical protein
MIPYLFIKPLWSSDGLTCSECEASENLESVENCGGLSKAFSVAWHGVKFWSGVAEHWRGGLSFRSGQSDDMSQLSRMGCRASFGDRLEIGVAV